MNLRLAQGSKGSSKGAASGNFTAKIMRHILAHMFIPTDESRATLGSFSGLSALSWAVPRLYQYPKFLSDDEIDHLVNYARGSKIFEAAEARLEAVRQTGQDESSLPLLTSVYFDWNAIYNDPIVNAIEQRIAIVTGMPPHKHEEPLNVHRIRTLRRDLAWPQNKTSCRGKTCPRKVTSIHHDKVQKEHSTATVLVYLNDVSEGGGTIFPCGSIPPRAPHDGVVSGACSEAFKEGARWYDGSSPHRRQSMTNSLKFFGRRILAAMRLARKTTWPIAVKLEVLQIHSSIGKRNQCVLCLSKEQL